jgi:hypothetical protein
MVSFTPFGRHFYVSPVAYQTHLRAGCNAFHRKHVLPLGSACGGAVEHDDHAGQASFIPVYVPVKSQWKLLNF